MQTSRSEKAKKHRAGQKSINSLAFIVRRGPHSMCSVTPTHPLSWAPVTAIEAPKDRATAGIRQRPLGIRSTAPTVDPIETSSADGMWHMTRNLPTNFVASPGAKGNDAPCDSLHRNTQRVHVSLWGLFYLWGLGGAFLELSIEKCL